MAPPFTKESKEALAHLATTSQKAEAPHPTARDTATRFQASSGLLRLTPHTTNLPQQVTAQPLIGTVATAMSRRVSLFNRGAFAGTVVAITASWLEVNQRMVNWRFWG